MSFFRSMFGICRGPYVSRDLKKHSWGRTLWHLFLVCFLCSVFIGIGNYLLLGYRWRAAIIDFNNTFGYRLMLSERWFSSEKQPKVSRVQELPYDSLLVYVSPDGFDGIESDETLQNRNVVVLWSPAVLAFFARIEKDRWVIFYIQPNSEKVYHWNDDFSGMKKEVARLASIKLEESEQKKIYANLRPWISGRRLFIYARSLYAVFVALMYFMVFFAILLITLLFSVLFKFFSGERSSVLPFGELWKVSIYTMFPVLFVLSFLPALQLPGVSYFYDLLVVGWAVYLFVVLRYLVTNPDDPEEEEKEENNDVQ